MLNMKKEKEVFAAALEENDIAEKLNEAIKKTEETKNEENDESPLDEFTPVEELSFNIAGHLAFMVAERFEPIAEKIGPEVAKKLVVRIENSKPETAVNMLQSMFLANGMVHAAEELDLLSYCADHDSEAYILFNDELFETDIFDWYSIESLFDELRKSSSETQSD